jgi:hypothetical protein
MEQLVSQIPKEKLKVGKLYKVKHPTVLVTRYRVWLGADGWSGGSLLPQEKDFPMYSQNIGVDYSYVIVLNKRATPFKAGNYKPTSTFTKPAFKQKQIRFLNRP